jgi:hypothetical protein
MSVDENLDSLVGGLKSGIKTEKPSDRFFDDMEWFLLAAMMRCPDIIPEISRIIEDPKKLTGHSDGTSHALIFQALTNLADEGIEPHFERLYAECEKIQDSNPLVRSYSRAAIMELDFQAATEGLSRRTATETMMDIDHNRIRAKFRAEQVLRRK